MSHERAAGRGPVLERRARWRAGSVALGLAGLMALAAAYRPLADASGYVRLAVTLALGLGVAASALLASLRGRGRAEQLAFYAFLALSLDGLGQVLQPLGWPAWPLFSLLLAALAVAEEPQVGLAIAGLLSFLAIAEAARGGFVHWRAAAAATVGYAAIVVAVHLALLFEKRRLRRTIEELDNLRYGFDDPVEEGGAGLSTLQGLLRRVSDGGRRELKEERQAELEEALRKLARVARLAVKAHALIYFEVDREREVARLLVAEGPPGIDAGAVIPLGQDPFAFVLERRVPFYATDFRRLLWELPYYKEPTHVGTLLAVPVLSGQLVSGLLIADRLEIQAYTGDEPDLLEGFAQLASIHLEQARAAVDREELGAEFAAVYQVSERLAALLDGADVVDLMLKAARELAGFEDAAVVMLDEGKTSYEVVGGQGWPQQYVGRRVAVVDGTWVAWLLRGQEAMQLIDDLADGRDGKTLPVLVLDEDGGRSQALLAVALKVGRSHAPSPGPGNVVGSDLFGAFVLLGRRGAFHAAARRVLGLLANQAAATLWHIRLKDRERQQAARDALTGLHNRRSFDDHLEQARSAEDRRGGRMSLLLLDIDHFKQLNDTYGHQAGDSALRNIARVVQRQLRGADLACRYGGEEFAVIMPGSSEAGAVRLAERVRRAIEKEQLVFEGARLSLTASIGIAEWPGGGREAAALIASADRALYAAKDSGRNRVVAASGLTPPMADAPGGPSSFS